LGLRESRSLDRGGERGGGSKVDFASQNRSSLNRGRDEMDLALLGKSYAPSRKEMG